MELPGWHELPLQHPDGQLVGSQMHVPPEHRWPAAHTEPPGPQLQLPPTHRSALVPQPMHALPLVPHWLEEVAVTQVLPLQHPEGQDDESHTHVPLEHRWPGAHAAPLPHRQAPPVQAFAVAVQPTQVAPLVPQSAVVGGETQVLPLQHPEGQLVESQMQLPLEHRWPGPHALPPPQRQLPPEHESAVGPQLVHVVPLAPHAAAWFPATHELPLQHPAQVGPSHTQVPELHR